MLLDFANVQKDKSLTPRRRNRPSNLNAAKSLYMKNMVSVEKDTAQTNLSMKRNDIYMETIKGMLMNTICSICRRGAVASFL